MLLLIKPVKAGGAVTVNKADYTDKMKCYFTDRSTHEKKNTVHVLLEKRQEGSTMR